MLFDLGSKSSLCRAFFFSQEKKNEMQDKKVSNTELITICQGWLVYECIWDFAHYQLYNIISTARLISTPKIT